MNSSNLRPGFGLCHDLQHDIYKNDSVSDAASVTSALPVLTSSRLVLSLNGHDHIQAMEETLGLLDSILQPNRFEMMSSSADYDNLEDLVSSEKRPKSFLHDEMSEFNQIFSELVSTPQRKFPMRSTSLIANQSPPLSLSFQNYNLENTVLNFMPPTRNNEYVNSDAVKALQIQKNLTTSGDFEADGIMEAHQTDPSVLMQENHVQTDVHGAEIVPCLCQSSNSDSPLADPKADHTADTCYQSLHPINEAGCTQQSVAVDGSTGRFMSLEKLKHYVKECGENESAWNNRLCEPMNEDDTDSGYQTGESSVLAMVSAAKKLDVCVTISRDELSEKIEKFNKNLHGLVMNLLPDSVIYQGNIRVHINLYRPIKMSLSSRPSSIYDILVRSEARLPENESSVALFHLPNNTFKAIHITSETTTNMVIKTLLNKFNITDNPRRFALYERIIKTESEKCLEAESQSAASMTFSAIRRIAEDDYPLELCLHWSDKGLDQLDRFQFVLQENDPGEIMWEAFSLPELHNFLRILLREEYSYTDQIRQKYWLMKREMERLLQQKRQCNDQDHIKL